MQSRSSSARSMYSRRQGAHSGFGIGGFYHTFRLRPGCGDSSSSRPARCSALIMTEVAFYPAFVLAAWAIARAVAVPSLQRQALALAAIVLVFFVRLQALVLLPAYATAVLVDASFTRRPRRVLLHLPAAGGIVLFALVWSGWQLRHGGPFAKVLGGYEAAAETNYAVGAAARFVLYHFGDLVLISGVIPFCALLLLVVRVVTSREEDENVRAFVATTLALSLWVV